MGVLGPTATVLLTSLAAMLPMACGERDDVARNDPGERRGPTEAGESRVGRVATSLVLLPLARRAADVVERPAGIEVDIATTGSDAALARLCAGKTDLALSDRALREAERKVCRKNGIAPVRSVVAHQVVALYRHEGLDIACLTVAQLRNLWRPGSEIARYSDLAPGFPDRPVTLIGYPFKSSTSDFFARQVTGRDGPLRADVRFVGERLRLEAELRSTPGSLGFGPYMVPLDGRQPDPVAINAGNGCVLPSARAAQSGAYALSAPLFMYSSRQALEKATVKELVDYILDDAAEVTSYRGVVPPERSQYPEAEPRG